MAEAETKWSVDHSLAERGRFKDYGKKHPREYAACFDNLGQVVELLGRFGGVKGFQIGCFRSEGLGVYRIGQTAVKHAKETRLYVLINETERLIHVLTIGGKDSQSEDIRRCHAVARDLKG